MESSEVKDAKSAAPSRVLICFAVKEEAAEFKKHLRALPNRRHVEILLTGMGAKNAKRVLLEKLAGTLPTLVLTCGFAGALDPALKIGDVLFDEDPEAGLAEASKTAGATPGKIFCSLRVATTAAEKTDLRHSTSADAVEMESGVIRKICREKKIPSATLRVISDAADQDLPLDFNTLMTAEDTLSMSKLARAVLKSPGKIRELMALQRHTRLAARQLAHCLDKLLRQRDR